MQSLDYYYYFYIIEHINIIVMIIIIMVYCAALRIVKIVAFISKEKKIKMARRICAMCTSNQLL